MCLERGLNPNDVALVDCLIWVHYRDTERSAGMAPSTET